MLKKSLSGGHTTNSGHRIGLTSDQMTDFAAKRFAAVHDIVTDPSFTPEEKKKLIQDMPSMKDFGFYDFLNVQYQSGPSLAKYITQFVSENRPRNTVGLKGTKKRNG